MTLPSSTFKNYRTALLSLMLTAILVAMPTARADNRANDEQWYQVDLILFLHNIQDSMASEARDQTASLPSPLFKPGVIALKPVRHIHHHELKPYRLLPERFFKLKREERRLNENDNYQVLTHIAWQQPGLNREQAKTVYFSAGEIYDAHGQRLEGMIGPEHAADLFHQIEGTLRISLGRYFNVNADLRLLRRIENLPIDLETQANNTSFDHGYNAQTPPPAAMSLLPDGYRMLHLQQTRRMRDNQLNYFDHPLFGLLVKITPLKNMIAPSAAG